MITERFSPDLGGVARSATRIAHRIRELGVEVHVLAWTRTLDAGRLDTQPLDGSTDDGSRLHRLGMFSNLDLSLQHSTNVVNWLHEQHGFSACWGHYVFPAGFLCVMLGQQIGRPVVVSARGNDIDRLMFPPGDFARLTWTLERADWLTSVSADLAAKIDVLLGRDAGVHVLHNVVDGEVFAPADDSTTEIQSTRRALGVGDDEAVLAFCGELRHKKGLPFLLSALNFVRQQRPVRFLVIGDVRPRERAHLDAFAADHPESGDRIIVTGRVDDAKEIARMLRASDVFLQPSVWEGLPNALLEAMACGCVCIASDAGGIPEVIRHGEDGFLLPIAQLDKLGPAILEALDLDPQQRRGVQQAARRRIETAFHPDNERSALQSLLDSVFSVE
jgi:glycosyltransferase involved in cell wall biosynthesis